MIASKVAETAIVPLPWPGELQPKPNGPVQPCEIRLILPPVVVLKVPEPVSDVQLTVPPSVVVRVPPLPATLKLVVESRCQLCADASAGRASIAALTAANASKIVFLLMLHLSLLLGKERKTSARRFLIKFSGT